MVDSLYEVSENTAVSGLTILKENLLCDGNSLSEAGLVENMAQTIALYGGYLGFLEGKTSPEIGFLGAVKSLEIHVLPKVGTKIKTHVAIVHDIMGIRLSEAQVKNDKGEILATAEIKTAKGNRDWPM